jgi:hypothetical protein
MFSRPVADDASADPHHYQDMGPTDWAGKYEMDPSKWYVLCKSVEKGFFIHSYN